MLARRVTIAARTPPISTVSSPTQHRPPEPPQTERRRQQPSERGRGHDDDARTPVSRPGVEPPGSPAPLDRPHPPQDRAGGHDLDVRQGVTSRHETSSVARDDAVKAERARRRLIAYYIADLDLDGRRRPDLEQIAVAQERQHAAAARAQAERVPGLEEGAG